MDVSGGSRQMGGRLDVNKQESWKRPIGGASIALNQNADFGALEMVYPNGLALLSADQV